MSSFITDIVAAPGEKIRLNGRGSFDPDGKIAHAWPKVKTAEHADEVLAVFDALASG